MNTDDANVIALKRGEECLRLSIKRSLKGIIVSAKAHPAIEELIKSWGDGAHRPISVYGRNWTPVGKDAPALQVYNLTQRAGTFPMVDGYYRIDQPGAFLIDDVSTPGTVFVNLSFLRIPGVSASEGIQFEVRGVFTVDQTRQAALRIGNAARRFYSDYLLPVDFQIVISTQEVR